MAREEIGKDKKGKRNKTQSILQPAFNFASSLNSNSWKSKAKEKKRELFGELLSHNVPWQMEVTLRVGKATQEAEERNELSLCIWVSTTTLTFLGASVGINKPWVVWVFWAPELWCYSRAGTAQHHPKLKHLQLGRGGGTTSAHSGISKHSLTTAGLQQTQRNPELAQE